MATSILIIGEDPAGIDFDGDDAPPITPDQIRDGLNGARDRLVAKGYDADILWTLGPDTLADKVGEALRRKEWDLFVIGAGLRTLPKMALSFETLINLLHRGAPAARFAFNANPADSDTAALRVVEGA